MSYKKKNILLAISVGVLLLFIYVFNISETFEYMGQYKELLKEKEKIDNSTVEVRMLRNQSAALDSILKKENISINNSFQQIVLKKINDFKETNAIELTEFSNMISIKDNGIEAQLYPITVQGNFNELLSFLNYMEQQGLGEIKNYSFLKKKNYRTRKEYLQLKLYLKKINTNL